MALLLLLAGFESDTAYNFSWQRFASREQRTAEENELVAFRRGRNQHRENHLRRSRLDRAGRTDWIADDAPVFDQPLQVPQFVPETSERPVPIWQLVGGGQDFSDARFGGFRGIRFGL